MLNLHLLECTLKGYDHISDLLLAKYWVITGCKYTGCSSLTSISIPDGVTSIEDYTFFGCSHLTTISIPESVTNIGEGVFFGCSNLEEIHCYHFSKDWREAFDNSLGDITLHLRFDNRKWVATKTFHPFNLSII